MSQNAPESPDRQNPQQEEEELPPEDLGPADADLPDHDWPHASYEEREQMLRDKNLENLLRVIIRRNHVPESHVDDVLQVTLMAAYHTERLPAGSGKERNRYISRIAGRKVADHFRRAEREVECDDGVEVDDVMPAAVQAVDLVAERDMLAKVMVVPLDDHQKLWCFVRYKLGEELCEIAEELGVGYEQLRRHVADIEDRLHQRAVKLRKYGRISGVLVMLLALGATWRMERVPGMAHDDPGQVALLEPAVSTHVVQTDPADWARVLRGEAYADCMNFHWLRCLHGLDAARELDPAGDSDPAALAARHDAVKGAMTTENKTGGLFVPRGRRVYGPWASR